jgi:hypothetical protein
MLGGMSELKLETEDSPGLSWGFGSFLFEKAFGELAAGLRWMFWGLLLQIGGGALALPGIVLIAAKQPVAAMFFLPVGLTAAGVGGLVVLWGEQKCLHLKLPLGMTESLPGRRWLRLAYACQLGAILGRFLKNLIPKPWRTFILGPLQLLGFIFLLLFLRKLADVIARTDLKRLIDLIFVLVAAMLVCLVLIAGGAEVAKALPKLLPKVVWLGLMAGCLGVSGLAFLGVIASYLVLLRRMASAVQSFAEFLASGPDPDTIEPNPSLAD